MNLLGNSNTTLVKVKLQQVTVLWFGIKNSNTTLVKVKLSQSLYGNGDKSKFKYNTC